MTFISPGRVVVFKRLSRSVIRFSGFFISCLMVYIAGCQAKPSVTLALLGDLMLGRGMSPNSDSFTYLASELSSVDLALANLESPLTYSPLPSDSPYNLCTSFERANMLSAWGFDLLSITNNHQFDCGPDGFTETSRALIAEGITTLGPDMQPVFIDLNGLRLAFIAFEDISSPIDVTNSVQAIHSLRADGTFVIVSVHWGVEYQGAPSARQEFLAQQFAQAGATLIWGHHPHVLQQVVWFHPPSGITQSSSSTLVLYSLGNALFDQGGLMDTRSSALVKVTLQSQGVVSIRAVPFVIDVVNSRVIQPDEGTACEILERINLP